MILPIVTIRHISVTWSPVLYDVRIPFDLESSPLQIKTDSTAGSGEKIRIETYTAAGQWLGQVIVEFTSPMKYNIYYCADWTSLPVQPPDEVNKTWTIQKTATAFSIECNGVEVLNYKFGDSSKTNCITRWGGDVVDKIMFNASFDTASDSYRAKPTGDKRVIIMNHKFWGIVYSCNKIDRQLL